MEEFGLPQRLFETGFEPTGRKRINNYFNLRWVEVIKESLSDTWQEKIAESQFRQIMLMGSHTFSVMFCHQILSRQLVTDKKYELWWTFAGKPIRYAIGDFALVMGLNCGTPPDNALGLPPIEKGKKKGKAKVKQGSGSGDVWKSLFGKEEKITAEGIIGRLTQKDKCKDEDTKLRLALLLLVEGILCPTSGTTQIRPEVVEMLGDIDAFMEYPWGRESFLLTVGSAKPRSAAQYTQDTVAIPGFAHAIVLVTVCACPQIIADVRAGADLLDESLPIEDIVDGVCARSIKINVVTVHTLEIIGQAKVRSLLCETDEIPGFEDEVADVRVGHMVTLIRQDFPFEINTWRGGVKASNGKHGRGLDVVGEEGTDDGTEAEQRRPTFSNSAGDNGQDVDLATLLTTAGESFKQLTVPIFEGCCRSMKEHFDREITSVKTALTIQLHLQHEEFMEAMGFRNRPPSTQADPMNSGFVLHRQRQQTAEDATGDRSAATTGMGGGFESTVPGNGGGSSPLDTVGGQAENIDDVMDIAREINVDDEGGGTSSVAKVGGTSTNMDADAEFEGPIPVAGDSGVTSPVGGQASDSANPVLDTVVAEEAREPPEALCKDVNPLVSSSPQKSVQTPTDTLDAPEKKGRTGDQVKRKETNVAMEDKVQGTEKYESSSLELESLASIAAETRASKRHRGPPIKYTPPGHVVKKTKIPAPAKKKRTQLAKKTKPSPAPLPAVSIPSVVPPQNITGTFMTRTQIGPLVGGFNPCVRVNAFHLARFRTLLHTPEEYNIGEGVIVSNADFVTFFEATHPQTTKTADMAVTFIRARLRRSSITAYDFLSATFVESLRAEYHNFCRVNDIGKFSFSNNFGKQGLANMKWSANVDVLYCPCQLGTHWIGLCIDIVHCCIYVLDCNPTCIPPAKLEVLLQPIIVLMPLLIRLNGDESCSATAMAGPLPLHLIELPFLCEPPGLSCVATMLGMELHAADSLKGAESITTSDLEVAAQTYAFEAFSTFMPDVLANYTVD